MIVFVTGGMGVLFKKVRIILLNLSKIEIINKKTERFLASLSLILILALILSQVGLFNEATRTFFTNIDEYEGVNINDLDEVFKQGQLTLKLIDTAPDENINILINGVPEYIFNQETLVIDTRNNCVIEIDGTKLKSSFKVKIINKSDNIAINCIDKEIEIHSNIEVLTRIFLK